MDDLISRADAIDIVNRYNQSHMILKGKPIVGAASMVIEMEGLPSADRPKGRWEHQELAPTNWTFCSVCGRQRSKKYKWYYYPNCGADMRGEEMSNIEKYPKCHMRTSLGNCDPIGGFCTSVNKAICEALHKAAESERPSGKWLSHYDYCKRHGYIPSGMMAFWWCDQCEQGVDHTTKFCPHCGAKMLREDNK